MIQLFSECMLESPGLSLSRHKIIPLPSHNTIPSPRPTPPLPCRLHQHGTSGMLSEWNTYIGKVAHLLSETIANTSQHLGNRGNPVNRRADQVSLTKYLQDHGLWCRLVNQSIILVCHQKIRDTCVRVNWSRVDM